ncbi:MAG: alpha/beta hydrolase family protein [Gaiellaceae bacterium]
MKKRAITAIIAVLACAGATGAGAAPGLSGTWVGAISFRSPAGVEPATVSIQLRGRRAVVSLGRGHDARTAVVARVSGRRLRLSIPARPGRLAFDGRLKGGRITGTVRNRAVRGRFSLRRGRALEEATLGLYRFADGRPLGVWSGEGPRVASLYEEGEVRGLYRTRPGTYAVGAGLQTRSPSGGTATFTGGTATWRGTSAQRVPVREEEVFVRSAGALLACTLALPPGSGKRPAIAFAHGGGPAPRSYNSVNQLYFNQLGIATLSCDKRGVGQSGGSYPGDLPTEAVVDRYARDVEAQARWLRTQPEIDAARIGIAGASQAGWIMPVAASREPAIRFMVGFVPPTLTQGETDLWAQLNDQGRSPPTRSDEELEAEVRRAGPSGVDPMPAIRAMRIPAVWLFGGKDRIVPTRLCVERLDPVTREAGRDFSYRTFPGGTHGLVLTPNGLLDEQARSSHMVDGLYQAVRDWLQARGFSG